MRGTIEVSGSGSDLGPASVPALSEVEVPMYVSLDLDIDAPHDAPVIPNQTPSAIRGQQELLITRLPITNSPDSYRAHSPYQVFDELSSTSLTETQRWDVVAYIWGSNTAKESLANGQRLYAQNCAACHGENGAGNGVFADKVATDFGKGMSSTNNGRPVDFTDPTRMLGASPALLQGKILRGGMGTGMPMWGSIFTEEQIWDLIAYLYSFQFEYHQ